MEENELSMEAAKAYEELKDRAATSKQMIVEQTRQKHCNVMTKYLTDIGLTHVSVDELPVTIDGITFDVIPEKADPNPIQQHRSMLPAQVQVLTPCPECGENVWTIVADGNLANLGEVLQSDFTPRHKCPDVKADAPLEEFNGLKADDVDTWGTLTRLLQQFQQEFEGLFGGKRNG